MAMSKIVVPHLIHLFIRPFDFRFNAGVAASTPGGVLKPRACHHLVALQALIQFTVIGVVAGFGAGKQRDQAVLLHTEYQAGLGGFVGVIGPAFSAGFGKSDFLHAAFFVIEAQAFAAGFGHDGQIQRAVHGQILQGGAGAAGLVVGEYKARCAVQGITVFKTGQLVLAGIVGIKAHTAYGGLIWCRQAVQPPLAYVFSGGKRLHGYAGGGNAVVTVGIIPAGGEVEEAQGVVGGCTLGAAAAAVQQLFFLQYAGEVGGLGLLQLVLCFRIKKGLWQRCYVQGLIAGAEQTRSQPQRCPSGRWYGHAGGSLFCCFCFGTFACFALGRRRTATGRQAGVLRQDFTPARFGPGAAGFGFAPAGFIVC